VFLEFHLWSPKYFNIIVHIICESAEPQFEGFRTYSANFGFLCSILSLKNKSNKDILQCCKKLKVLLTLSESLIPI
jgi:hypothetical protein